MDRGKDRRYFFPVCLFASKSPHDQEYHLDKLIKTLSFVPRFKITGFIVKRKSGPQRHLIILNFFIREAPNAAKRQKES
jgi:hypothetical protein